MNWVGRRLPRYEDPVLLQGNGRFVGDLARGVRDRVRAGRFRLGALRVDDRAIDRVGLDLLGDAVHRGDRLDRILPGRGFGREHHGV